MHHYFTEAFGFVEKEEKDVATKEKAFYKTKKLEEINEREKQLKQENEKDQTIINDENAFPKNKEEAEARLEQRNEEIVRLQTIIQETEDAKTLREKIKEICKKHVVTVTAIFLAAGVTIGAVLGTMTNAVKKLGTVLGNGLKTLGAKAASALPGLIGAIVSFIFKAAGSVIGLLAEHTWLLILPVVAFLFEKLIKERS